MATKLTEKQKAFINEYVIDKNATQAAIRAGYSERTAQAIGSENLTKPLIAAAIEEKLDKAAKKSEITARWVIDQMKDAIEGAKKNNQHSAQIKGIELLAKHIDFFERDNESARSKPTPILFNVGNVPVHNSNTES